MFPDGCRKLNSRKARTAKLFRAVAGAAAVNRENLLAALTLALHLEVFAFEQIGDQVRHLVTFERFECDTTSRGGLCHQRTVVPHLYCQGAETWPRSNGSGEVHCSLRGIFQGQQACVQRRLPL